MRDFLGKIRDKFNLFLTDNFIFSFVLGSILSILGVVTNNDTTFLTGSIWMGVAIIILEIRKA